MKAVEIITFLKSQVGFIRGFPDSKLKELIEGSTLTTFEPNEAVVEFGEEGRFLGILLSGEAEASVTDDSGHRHIINALRPGDVFGEMSLMTGNKTMANIVGVTPCEVLLIPQHLFSSILIAHPPAIMALSRTLSKRLTSFSFDQGDQDLAASALRKSEDPYGFRLRSHEPMRLLVVNCGSSSLKYKLFDTVDEDRNAGGVIEKIGEEGTRHIYRSPRGETEKTLPLGDHRDAFDALLTELMGAEVGVLSSTDEVSVVGHRVVHGGDRFSAATVITEDVMEGIESASDLAPLHNPANLIGINEAMESFPGVPHVAVFDTAFHQTLPPYAYLYGLPFEYYEEKRIRRYGFHGTSHAYVALRAAEFLKRPYNKLELVTCHLGNGASICAVDHGRSVDTTMGLTPAEGLVMGTRCGDIDPAVLIHLMRTEGKTADELDHLINKESGLKGLSGISNDMREVQQAASEGNHRALLAFKTFCYKVRKYIGAYSAAMGGLDVVVFTGGIGQGSAGVRSVACQGLAYMGIRIDEEKNRDACQAGGPCDISADDAAIRVLVIPTDEERMIARESLGAVNQQHVTKIIRSQEPVPIPMEVSAHHVHLSTEHVEALYGEGHQLTSMDELSQPGQYACEERVSLLGPKGRVERVRVLGPVRQETQVEISMTEQFQLGVHPPIRGSGDLEGSPGIILEGPKGKVTLKKGVICALRHLHMSPKDALQLGLRDKDLVRVRVESKRQLIFGGVLVRVNPNYRLAMHIDTDEANAANIKTGLFGYIEEIQSRV